MVNDKQMTDYKEQIRQIPIIELKKTTSSWIVLTLAILATVAVGCTVISVITKISNSWFSLIISLIQLLLISLVCAGFWRTYIAGKSKQSNFSSGGPRMLRGVLKFYEVITCLIIVAIIVLAVVVLATSKSCADKLPDNETVTEISSAFMGILIGIIVALVVVFVVVLIYFKTALSFANTIIDSIDSKYSQCPFTYTSLTVMFFIIGAFNLIVAISQIAMTSFINDFFNELGTVGAFFSSAKLTKLDVANLFSQIAQSGMYIFGGIFVTSYKNLHPNIRRKLAALQKPE